MQGITIFLNHFPLISAWWAAGRWARRQITEGGLGKNRKSQGVRCDGENALIDLRSRDSRLTAVISADAFFAKGLFSGHKLAFCRKGNHKRNRERSSLTLTGMN